MKMSEEAIYKCLDLTTLGHCQGQQSRVTIFSLAEQQTLYIELMGLIDVIHEGLSGSGASSVAQRTVCFICLYQICTRRLLVARDSETLYSSIHFSGIL